MMARPIRAAAMLALWLVPSPARAQAAIVEEPIGRFAIDLHGSTASFPQDAASAAGLSTSATSLPARGFGGRVAVTWYPLRLGPITVGLGGEIAATRATKTPETGGTFETRFTSAAPQLSLNFGHRRGWSYLSGGVSRSRLTIRREGGADAPRAQTINYGGGARWFARRHLAFSFDVRFYAISPTAAVTGVPARARTTMLVVSAGVSIK